MFFHVLLRLNFTKFAPTEMLKQVILIEQIKTGYQTLPYFLREDVHNITTRLFLFLLLL